MTIHPLLFTILLWGAVVWVVAGAAFLLYVLLREWKSGDLW